MSVRLQHRTRMFARVLGPFFTIAATVVILRSPDMRQLLSEFTASDVWPWVTGASILMGGIAIVAFHQVWRGPAAIIVSVLGWLFVARGIFLLAFPDAFASVANRVIGAVGCLAGRVRRFRCCRPVSDIRGMEARASRPKRHGSANQHRFSACRLMRLSIVDRGDSDASAHVRRASRRRSVGTK